VSVSLWKLLLHSSHSVLPHFHVSQVGRWQARQGRAGQGRACWLTDWLLSSSSLSSSNDQSKWPVKMTSQNVQSNYYCSSCDHILLAL